MSRTDGLSSALYFLPKKNTAETLPKPSEIGLNPPAGPARVRLGSSTHYWPEGMPFWMMVSA
jgi:hypothetical protein